MTTENGNGYGVAYKAKGVPISLDREFRDAARDCGMTIKSAFARLLEPSAEVEHQTWVRALQRRILAGQHRAADYSGAATTTISTHVPEDFRRAVNEAAAGLGINSGGAGRLILIGLAGRIGRALAGPDEARDGT